MRSLHLDWFFSELSLKQTVLLLRELFGKTPQASATFSSGHSPVQTFGSHSTKWTRAIRLTTVTLMDYRRHCSRQMGTSGNCRFFSTLYFLQLLWPLFPCSKIWGLEKAHSIKQDSYTPLTNRCCTADGRHLILSPSTAEDFPSLTLHHLKVIRTQQTCLSQC